MKVIQVRTLEQERKGVVLPKTLPSCGRGRAPLPAAQVWLRGQPGQLHVLPKTNPVWRQGGKSREGTGMGCELLLFEIMSKRTWFSSWPV